MNNEIYFQYTKGWHQVNLSRGTNPFSKHRMVEWCWRHQSPHKFHVIMGFDDDLREIETAIRFQSPEDAMLFAFEWT